MLFHQLKKSLVRNSAMAAVIAVIFISILSPRMASAAGTPVDADQSVQVGDVNCLIAHATDASRAPHSGGAGIFAAPSYRTCASHLRRASSGASPQARPITRPPEHGDIP